MAVNDFFINLRNCIKQYKKTTILVVICLISLIISILLIGAGEKTASNEQIMTDIKREDSYFSNYGLDVKSFEVTQRQTNIDEKTDCVWVYVEALNSDFTYTCDYNLTYILYNEGWVLEEYYEYDSRQYQALTEPDKDSIVKEYSEKYGECELTNYSCSDNSASFIFKTMQKESEYLSVEKEISVFMKFQPHTLWIVCSEEEKEINYYWDNICGSWVYEDSNGVSLNVEVLEFDAENNEAKFNYSLSYVYENRVTGDRILTFESKENKTYSLEEYSFKDGNRYKYFEIQNELGNTRAKIWFCGGEMDGKSGVYVNISQKQKNYWLTKHK